MLTDVIDLNHFLACPAWAKRDALAKDGGFDKDKGNLHVEWDLNAYYERRIDINDADDIDQDQGIK
jgi:hypothetical protein